MRDDNKYGEGPLFYLWHGVKNGLCQNGEWIVCTLSGEEEGEMNVQKHIHPDIICIFNEDGIVTYLKLRSVRIAYEFSTASFKVAEPKPCFNTPQEMRAVSKLRENILKSKTNETPEIARTAGQ